jgi:hypothetical protein
MMKLKTWSYLFIVSFVLCAMLSCNRDNNDAPGAVPPSGLIAFFNLVPNETGINFYINGTRQNTNKIIYADYSGYMSVPSGQQSLSFKDSLYTELFSPVQFIINADSSTIFVAGKKNAVSLIVTRDTALIDTGNIKPKLRFVHTSADSPAFDLFLSNINQTSIPNQAYKSISAFARVDTGRVTVKLNLAGTNTTVLNGTVNLLPHGVYTLFIYGSYTGTSTNGLNLGIIANH